MANSFVPLVVLGIFITGCASKPQQNIVCDDIKTIYPQAAARGFKDWQTGIKRISATGRVSWNAPFRMEGFQECEITLASVLDYVRYTCSRDYSQIGAANAAYERNVAKVRQCLRAATQTSGRTDSGGRQTSFELDDATNPWRLEIEVWRHTHPLNLGYSVDVDIVARPRGR